MTKVIEAIQSKKMGWKKAVKEFSVPKTTLMKLSKVVYGTTDTLKTLQEDTEKPSADDPQETVPFHKPSTAPQPSFMLELRFPQLLLVLTLTNQQHLQLLRRFLYLQIRRKWAHLTSLPFLRSKRRHRTGVEKSVVAITFTHYKEQLMEAKLAKELKEAERQGKIRGTLEESKLKER
ncbi:hypothetical protein J6590_093808 [Homalodisca vitripennis]|nr:hypothetical protein J6590_093808 [Homalodisca vitripennis]